MALWLAQLNAVFASTSAEEDPWLISFYLSVYDKAGKPVENLTKNAFEVFEDRVPQTINSVAFEKNSPLSLGILIDISRGMGAGGTTVALNWLRFLAQKMKSPDEMFVNAFSDESQEVADYISPEDYLDDPLDKLGTGGQSRSGLAVDLGLIKLRDAKNRKRGLLMISPGRDSAGRATEEHIARFRFPIYALGISGTEGFGGIMDRLKSVNIRGSALSVYANLSGGIAFFADSPPAGEQWLEKFYSEFRNQYRLEYRSSNTKKDGKLRNIKVRVKNSEYTVSHLQKYQAPYKSTPKILY